MHIKFILKLLLLSIILVIPTNVSAVDYLNEEFNQPSLDSNIWNVLNESSSSILSGKSLLVSNVESNKSLYVINKVPLAESTSIAYEVKFKYSGFGFGSGIALNDAAPVTRIFNDDPNLTDWTIVLWPTGSNSFSLFSMPCPEIGSCLPENNIIFTVSGTESLAWHTLYVRYDLGRYSVKLDDSQYINTINYPRSPKYIWMGNPMITGGTAFSSFEVDYVRITSLSTPPTPTPSPTPTPTPTPTPSPTPSFPYFSQNDPRWKDEIYDNASKWAGIDKYGIGRWGCALTSAAMVLQKNGVKALDGTELDPSKLNTWLKSQPDGYVGLGYLNWLAVTRYVRLSYEAGHSPTKLEFSRTGTPTFPSIIGLPGHFVVVHGEDGSNWFVNDPATLSVTKIPKTTALKSVNTFVPSMTDLSYMMFSTTSEVNVKINKEHSKEIKIDWQDEQIIDPQSDYAGPKNKIGIIPKPKNGEYELYVTNPSDTPKNFDIYLYNKQGQPYIKKMTLGRNSSIKFEVEYNKDRSNKIKIEHQRRYKYIWNSKKKWFDKIWDEFDKWEERLRD